MASKLLKTLIPFEVIFKDGRFLLVGIEPDFEYENNQRTEKIIGYKYEVVDTVDFDKIKVKIKGQKKPLMTSERLEELRENGEKIVVEFINGVDKLYIRRSGNMSSVEDSFSAEDIKLAEEN